MGREEEKKENPSIAHSINDINEKHHYARVLVTTMGCRMEVGSKVHLVHCRLETGDRVKQGERTAKISPLIHINAATNDPAVDTTVVSDVSSGIASRRSATTSSDKLQLLRTHKDDVGSRK